MAKDEIERLAGESSTFRRGEFSWTSGLEKKARKLYINEGLSLRAVASEIGCASSTVQQLADREGWMRSKTGIGQKTRDWLKTNKQLVKEDYITNQMTCREIAVKYDLAEKIVEAFIGRQVYKRSLSETFRTITVPKGIHGGKYKHDQAWLKWFDSEHTFSGYAEYLRAVRKSTACVLHRFRLWIDPKGLAKKNEYEIDHILSIRRGYYKLIEGKWIPRDKPLSLKLLSHPANLQLLTSKDNKDKSHSSTLTVKELKNAILLFENKHGKVFEDGKRRD